MCQPEASKCIKRVKNHVSIWLLWKVNERTAESNWRTGTVVWFARTRCSWYGLFLAAPTWCTHFPSEGGRVKHLWSIWSPPDLFPSLIFEVAVSVVAMEANILQRCMSAAIRAARWTLRMAASAHIVFVTMEHVIYKNYEIVVKNTVTSG